MFGNDNQNDEDQNKNGAAGGDMGAPMPPADPTTDTSLSSDVTSDTKPADETPAPTSIGDPTPPPDTSLVSSDVPTEDTTTPVTTNDAPTGEPVTTENGGLLGIKQDALQQLGPLVGHLDQTPEEKFRTLMMMIQAADDHNLVKEAFETAKQITDEKVRAQALLDVINEINYFTQQQKSDN
jgi:hypothetical protein